MQRLGVLMLALAAVLPSQAAAPAAGAHGAILVNQEPTSDPTPLDDPYLPSPTSPDIIEPDDGGGEEPSPLNPADN